MTKEIDKKNKENTIYKCDMCSKEVNRKENNKIYKQSVEDKHMKKKYDLCNECYKILERSINKYSRRNK